MTSFEFLNSNNHDVRISSCVSTCENVAMGNLVSGRSQLVVDRLPVRSVQGNLEHQMQCSICALTNAVSTLSVLSVVIRGEPESLASGLETQLLATCFCAL